MKRRGYVINYGMNYADRKNYQGRDGAYDYCVTLDDERLKVYSSKRDAEMEIDLMHRYDADKVKERVETCAEAYRNLKEEKQKVIKYFCDICGEEITDHTNKYPIQVVARTPIISGDLPTGTFYNYTRKLEINPIYMCNKCMKRRLDGESLIRINDKYSFDKKEEENGA